MKTVSSAAAAAARITPRHPPGDITGEVAVVTGASRGLGFLLARELARHSCRLVLCARNADELNSAAAQLRADGADVATVACELAEEGAPERLVDTALERYGRVDILVNNAGVIKVGPVESTSTGDYSYALATMTMAHVRATLAALPVMRRQDHGRIVNITSIGGKIAVPHLLPYSVAKAAAVAFSEGLRAELGTGPVSVTTVVPGLMRTGSHLRAEFSGRQEQEFTWFSLAASLPLVSMDAERAARRIVDAARRRQSELILTPLAQVAARAAAISPELTGAALRVTYRVLPRPGGGRPGATAGRELQPAIGQAVFDRLTTLGLRAARRFNQHPRPPAAQP